MIAPKMRRALVRHPLRAAVLALATACVAGTGSAIAIEGLPELEVPGASRTVAFEGNAPVVDLTVDASDRVYLVQEGRRTVSVIDWSGDRLYEVGRRDDGVLQMSMPQDVGWEGDRLWVFDRGRYQLHFFDGFELVERLSFPSFDHPDWEFPFITVGVTPGRKALAMPLIPQWVEGGRSGVSYPVVRAEPGGPILDTLWTATPGSSELEVLWPSGGGTAPVAQPFSADPVRAFVWSDSTRVEVRSELEPTPVVIVERTRLDGSVVFRTELAFEPDPLSEAEITAAVNSISAGWSDLRREPEEEVRRLFREALFVPPSRRPFQAVLVSEEGRVWIRMTPTAAEGGLGSVPPNTVGVPLDDLGGDATGSRWIVLSPDGSPEAQAQLPPRFVPMWIEGPRVVGVTTDASGEHAVVEIQVNGLPTVPLVTLR